MAFIKQIRMEFINKRVINWIGMAFIRVRMILNKRNRRNKVSKMRK